MEIVKENTLSIRTSPTPRPPHEKPGKFEQSLYTLGEGLRCVLYFQYVTGTPYKTGWIVGPRDEDEDPGPKPPKIEGSDSRSVRGVEG